MHTTLRSNAVSRCVIASCLMLAVEVPARGQSAGRIDSVTIDYDAQVIAINGAFALLPPVAATFGGIPTSGTYVGKYGDQVFTKFPPVNPGTYRLILTDGGGLSLPADVTIGDPGPTGTATGGVYNVYRFEGTGPVTFFEYLEDFGWKDLPGMQNRAFSVPSKSLLDITCSGGLRVGVPVGSTGSNSRIPNAPIIEISMKVVVIDPDTGSLRRSEVVTYLQGDTDLNQTLRWNMGTVIEAAPRFASVSVMARAFPLVVGGGGQSSLIPSPLVTVSGDGSAADSYQLQAGVTVVQIAQ